MSRYRIHVSLTMLLCVLLSACGGAALPPTQGAASSAPSSAAQSSAAAQPGSYNEAPTLSQQVAQGALPAVKDRLPEQPLVVDTVEQIGQYGGTWRLGFLGPADDNSYFTMVYDTLVRFTPQGDKVVPHIAESAEPSADFKTWTIKLRKGARWSDGEPMTADDIMFWYDDVLLNQELTPVRPLWTLASDRSPATVEKVDQYTVRFNYSQPNATFLMELAGQDGSARTYQPFLPAHYLKQFHAKYADAAELKSKISAASFSAWPELFAAKSAAEGNPERPVMAAWKPQSTLSDKVFVLKRNPYFVGVDRSGNQLPYIDEIRYTFYSDREALNLAALAGEFDMQIRHIDFTKYPLFVEQQQQSGYRVLKWNSFGGTLRLAFNMSYQDNPELAKLYNQLDLRKALSLGLNRDRMKELLYLGLGEARQPVPPPGHPFYPGDEYAHKYTQYDVAEANRLLDGLGLTKKNSEGYRLLPDGSVLTVEVSTGNHLQTYVDAAELVAEDWKAIGVKTDLQIRERSLEFQRISANQTQLVVWENDTTGFPFAGQTQSDPSLSQLTGPLWRQWFESQGKAGVEPSPEARKVADLHAEAKRVGPEEQARIGQEIYRMWADNLWQIGLVGMTPTIVIVSNKLRNVPEVNGHNWPLRTPGGARTEQFFFSGGAN